MNKIEFEYFYVLKDHFGNLPTPFEKKDFDCEDLQCEVCLISLVQDYNIEQSFKLTKGGRPVCFDCSNESALKLQELVKEIGLINLIQFRMAHLLKDVSPPNEPSKSQVEFKMIEFEKLQKAIQSLVEESVK